VQTGPSRVIVLVIQLFLQFALLLGRLSRVFGPVGVRLLIHRELL
jgi:hypothetical protein